MPTTFSQRIDSAHPANDLLSLGLMQLQARLRGRLAKLNLEAISSCEAERRASHSQAASAATLAGTLSYNFPAYNALFNHLIPKTLNRVLLRFAFRSWFLGQQTQLQEVFWNAFEIAVENPNRTPEHAPDEFALQFANALVNEETLLRDDFLGNFFRNQNVQGVKAKGMVAPLRYVLGFANGIYMAELTARAHIELRKRPWEKVKEPGLVRAQESEVTPEPENTRTASGLRLRNLEEPPDRMSLRDVVLKIFPELKKTILDARYYLSAEQKKNNHPSSQDISENFPLFADAGESEIKKYVIDRESTPHGAALQMITGICGRPLETINRYRHPMRKAESHD